jgi:4-hydroxybenzoate polyprenyltransferase
MVAVTRVAPTATGNLAESFIRLSRPGQWPKNLLVVCVPVLDLRIWGLATLGRLAWAVVTFTLASILVYVLNDVIDRDRDRDHPTNRHRPLASGRLSVPAAALFAAALAVLLFVVVISQPWAMSWPVGVYLVVSAAYSLGAKHVPLLDVFLVATGFLLRLAQGYVVVPVSASGWLLICVFSLCLLLTVGKRRYELTTVGTHHRPALRGYTVPLTEQLMALSAVLTAGSYLLYLRTEAPMGGHGPMAAALMAPLALFGLFRYLQLVAVQGAGGDPVRTLLRDPALVVNAVLWAGLYCGFLLAARSDAW